MTRTITDIIASIQAGQTSARSEVETALAKAREHESYHALLHLTE